MLPLLPALLLLDTPPLIVPAGPGKPALLTPSGDKLIDLKPLTLGDVNEIAKDAVANPKAKLVVRIAPDSLFKGGDYDTQITRSVVTAWGTMGLYSRGQNAIQPAFQAVVRDLKAGKPHVVVFRYASFGCDVRFQSAKACGTFTLAQMPDGPEPIRHLAVLFTPTQSTDWFRLQLTPNSKGYVGGLALESVEVYSLG